MNVSIIIPCYNEYKFIEICVDSIIKSCLSAGRSFEVLISDGGSTDGTKELLMQLEEKHDFIKVLENKKQQQVYALNQMIKIAQGEYIIRCDAHAIYSEDYVQTLITHLETNPKTGNVGVQVQTKSISPNLTSDAISVCLSSKFGVGGSHRSKFSTTPIECDTVLFGAWRKTIFLEVGLFDENFIRGQDLEHNLRIKKAGYRVIQLPTVGIQYFTRNTYTKLFNMMKQYASVKPLLIKKGHELPNIRSFIPISLYTIIAASIIITPYLSLTLFTAYILFAMIYSVYEAIKIKRPILTLNIFTGFLIQHYGHAYGMLYGSLAAMKQDKINWQHTR